MDGPLLFILGSGLLALALFMLRFPWVAGDWLSGIEVSALLALMGLSSIGFGLLLNGAVAVGMPLIVVVAVVFGTGILCRVIGRRHLRWLSYLSGGSGGMILVVLLPSGLEWGNLYVRGLPVRAEVVGMVEESTYDPDTDEGFQRFPVTYVTYQFDAPVDGQLHQFQRQGELSGRYRKGSGFVNVLYDPAHPNHCRMIRESHLARNGLIAAAVFLALGIGSSLMSRRGSPGRAATVNASPRR